MTETVSGPWGNDDEPESVMYALSIAGMGTPFTDYQGTLYGNPRYWPDGTSCAEFKDYGLARAVRVLCNNADAIKAALRTPPQNTDGEAVAWRIVGDDGAYLVYREEKDARDALGRVHSRTLRLDRIEPLVPASIVDDLRADLTRYIDIATKEATEAESLRAELDHLTKSGIIEVSIRNPSVADYMKHWEGRAEKAEAERDALAKALEPGFMTAVSDGQAGRYEVVIKFLDLRSMQDAHNALVRSTLKGDAP